MNKNFDKFDMEAENESQAFRKMREMVGARPNSVSRAKSGEQFFVKRLSEVAKKGAYNGSIE